MIATHRLIILTASNDQLQDGHELQSNEQLNLRAI